MKRFPAGWSYRPQCAITTLESEPEPDFAVVRGTAADYRDRHPGPGDVALIIEVADSSLSIDRDWKTQIYGRAAIPNYWIVNLVDWIVEVYHDPTGPAKKPTYRQTNVYRIGQTIELIVGDQAVRVPVGDLLLAE